MAELPMGIVRACLREIPVLTAEESFLSVDRTGIGTDTYEKGARNDIMATWRREAKITTTAATPVQPRTVASMRAAGLKVFGTKPA